MTELERWFDTRIDEFGAMIGSANKEYETGKDTARWLTALSYWIARFEHAKKVYEQGIESNRIDAPVQFDLNGQCMYGWIPITQPALPLLRSPSQ